MPCLGSPANSEVSLTLSPFPNPLPLSDVANNDDLGASIGLENDDDMFLWNVTFEGPESTLYEVSIQTFALFLEAYLLMVSNSG